MESPSPSPSEKTISSDDEIDYSVKPEFYDPDLDAKDDEWLSKRRAKVGGASDAVLSCSACFTTLCLESQRHEHYVTQYRAVFVVNCQVVARKTRIQSSEPLTSRKRKNEHSVDPLSPVGEESTALKAVCCGVCATEVGVFDQDEVYHFVNVVPSETKQW